ncbi:hypothetical protein ACFWHW_03835 [Streptomyces pharetrae]|uniref:hypothetical protein n=1 Tax=Streptomyces pharetrae TaxID=291370 RepID=UPI003651A8EA
MTNQTTDLPARLEAVLTERYTELGNPFSRMHRQEKGPDGWPAERPVGPHHVAEALRELMADEQAADLPAWEALYEPGNVSTYLIGYANDQDAATGMAEAWLRSQAEVTGRLEWVDDEQMATGRYDRWFELIECHGEGVDTGTSIVVRRRMADEAQPPSPRCTCGETACESDLCDCDSASCPVDHADEAQPATEAEAHPAEHSWAAELYDPLADEWVPGTRYAVRDRAVNHLAHARSIGPAWKDGTPVQRRLVRATTTYTVEPS